MSGLNLRLMSMPGDGLSRLLSVSRELVDGVAEPRVGYLPGAAVFDNHLELSRAAFAGLAEVELIDPVADGRDAILPILDRIDLLYVPGGNTFVLTDRLRKAGLMTEIADRLRGGLPYVGFSAGAVLCGLDILNSGDANACGCRDFAGLGVLPFSVNVHYPNGEDEAALDERHERLAAYLHFQTTPVLALEDDALLRVDDGGAILTEGHAWVFERSGSRRPY
jgi:peptidase E